ncbi:MAG: DNA alkylation repair protein [Candidatus Moranbacteria bacterium]|nr:DNA alkylation repair protein [Candidatus Moranbacteria bacterium]
MFDLKHQLINELKQKSNKKRAASQSAIFKTKKGEYAYGDRFIGVRVPILRQLAKKYYKQINFKNLKQLLDSKIHEYRQIALFIIILQFKNNKNLTQSKKIYDFYLKNLKRVNNWDLVDCSAHKIIGAYLLNKKDKSVLDKLATHNNLWFNRIAIISTFAFIDQGELNTALKLIKKLINHPHDLIHKACGWVLREIGKKDINKLKIFLERYYERMPRTMLRYAIEKFEQKQRKKILKGELDNRVINQHTI